MREFLRNSLGTCTIRLTTADPGGAMTFYTDRGFILKRPVLVSPVTLVFELPAGKTDEFFGLAQKRGDGCQMIKERGLHLTALRLWRRKCFVFCFALLVLFSLYGTQRIWFVEIVGADEIPKSVILAAAEECGIGFWEKVSGVRSESVKNQLLNLVPELQWAGVNFRGGIAVVNVMERQQKPDIQPVELVSDLIAAKDGIVVSTSILGGQSLCAPGQAVTKGEILVTGCVEHEYQMQYTRADGEVYALTQWDLTALCPRYVRQKDQVSGKRYGVSIILGRNKIKIYGNSGILDTTYDKMTLVKTLTLPGGYSLPVSLVIDTYRPYQEKLVVREDAEECAEGAMERCVHSGMLAGEILSSSVAGSEEENIYRFVGVYTCREMIARRREVILFEGGENANDRTNRERGTGGGSD